MPSRKIKGPTKTERFAQIYDGKDIKGAAKKVGMSYAYARRLATKGYILDIVNKRMAKQAEKLEISQQKVLGEYALIGFSDIKNYLNTDSDLFQDLNKLPEGISRAIESLNITRKTIGGGKKKMVIENIKFKLHAKLPALEAIGRYQGMFQKDNEQKRPLVNQYWQTFIDLQKQAKQELIDDSNNRIKEHLSK